MRIQFSCSMIDFSDKEGININGTALVTAQAVTTYCVLSVVTVLTLVCTVWHFLPHSQRLRDT